MRRKRKSSSFWIWCVVFGFLSHPLHVDPATQLFLSAHDDYIHAEIDSLFHVRNPGNVLDFLDQEERVRDLRSLEAAVEEMRAHLDDLMSRDDEDVDIEKVILKSEPDCARAGDLYKKLNLLESILLSLEAKGFKTENFIVTSRSKLPVEEALPDCLQSINSDSTAKLFDQLKAFKSGNGLHVSPESDIIPSVIPSGLTPLEYAASVADALKKNGTSWILYDMATFYYRLTGDGNTAMECARRALHFSPRKHRDIAYLNMASLLFRADYPRDAAALAGMALDVAVSVPGWTLMGLILASLSEFEKSIEALSNAVGLDKRNTKLQDYLYAIKCHAKVHKGLSDQHEALREVIEQFERIGITTKKIHALAAKVQDAKQPCVTALLETISFRERDTDFDYVTLNIESPSRMFLSSKRFP